jgi:predicted dehydrogenase
MINMIHKRFTLGLVGCGAIADSFYLPCLVKMLPAESIILVDSDDARRRSAAIKFGLGRTMADYSAALQEVSAVILAVPHRLHYSMAKQAMQHGVHVLVEKPMTSEHHQAAELVKLAEQNDLRLLVNNTRRFFPSYAHIKKLVVSSELGAPLSIDWCEGDQFQWPTASGFYFQSSAQPRGVLLDLGAHAMDSLCWWLGKPPFVEASESDSFGGPEATAHVKLRLDNCEISVRLSWLSKQRNSIRIRFENAMVEAGVWDWNLLTVESRNFSKRQLRLGKFASYSEFAAPLLNSFLHAIESPQSECHLINGSNILPSLSVLDDCYRNMQRFDLPWYPQTAVLAAQ